MADKQTHSTRTPTDLLEAMTANHRVVIRQGVAGGYFADAVSVVTGKRDYSRWAWSPSEVITLLACEMGITIESN